MRWWYGACTQGRRAGWPGLQMKGTSHHVARPGSVALVAHNTTSCRRLPTEPNAPYVLTR